MWIESNGEEVIQLDVAEMESAWRSSLKDKLQGEAMAAGAERTIVLCSQDSRMRCECGESLLCYNQTLA